MTGTAVTACARCGTELAPQLLQCPACRRLVHADLLQQVAAEAERAEQTGDTSSALRLWARALDLLPAQAPQRSGILERIQRLETAAPLAPTRAGGAKGIWAGAVAIVVLLLSKAKLLLLGLTKLGTLFSMAAFFAWYWEAYGWQFALGLVLSIYVHEMGHIAALKRYGIPASAPMFIPGIGALVRLKAHPPTPAQDARVGLAGPIWGAGAAVAAYGLYLATRNGLFASVAHGGAVLNLFNLIAVWQLDGSRGIASQNRWQRAMLAGFALIGFALTHEGLLILVGGVLAYRCIEKAPEEGDRGALLQFMWVLAALTLLATVRGPGGP